MAQNDIIVLDSILEQQRRTRALSLSESDYFEIFAFEQVLKNYDLSYEELFEGKVGAGDDGGIDGFFCFIDREILSEDSEQYQRKNPNIDLFLIQAKRTPSFSETSLEHVLVTVQDIFDLTKDMAKLKKFYNAKLIDRATGFRETYLKLAHFHPILNFYYVYASKGDASNIHVKVKNKGETLKSTIQKFFSGANSHVNFLGSRELLDASRIEKNYTLQLSFLETFLSRGDNNYIVLSSLEDYYRFIIDENNNLRRYVFESNVRDYQGNVEVNKDIQATLEANDSIDFWWLNNGISILASKATVAGKNITLDDVQIVNGLQTTTAIYNYLRNQTKMQDKDKRRSILIRIIVVDNADVSDKIIKATNFQTPIPAASLRATEKLQRDIEDYFKHNDLYYDRRKNYYKNIGKPAEKIISIPYLAQSVMSIVLFEPDNARARPSSLIKKDTEYNRVFNEQTPLPVYLLCARIMKTVDTFLRNDVSDYFDQEKNNLKFHIAMVATLIMFGKKYQLPDLGHITDPTIEKGILSSALKNTVDMAIAFANPKDWTIERTAKNREFVEYIFENLFV